MGSPTVDMARFLTGLTFEDVPRELAQRLKSCLLDAIGCALHGLSRPWAQIVNRWVIDQGGKPQSTLWRQKFKGPCANVALGLGVMIHSFDFDDYHNAKVHPGAPVIPAALTVGETLGASGRQVLAAIAAGYEAMIRISLATGPNASRMKGWHLTGTTGTFGAAAAAGKLWAVSQEEMAGALGMAGTQSCGLWAFLADGAMSKRFHAGKASQSGVLAADLAKRGFKGPTRILEAEDGGFCRATSDHFDLTLLTEGLGEVFHAADTHIKPYACCASSHSAVDAIRELKTRHGFSAGDVERVRVHTAGSVVVQCGFEYQAASVVQAQMSLKYIVAVTLIEGSAHLAQFTEDKISDPLILELARRVEVLRDPDIDRVYPERYANRVECILKDGQRFEFRVDFARGAGEKPLAFADVAEKFRSLSAEAIPSEKASRIVWRVENLENEGNIQELLHLLE